MLYQSADYALRAVLFVAQRGAQTSCTARSIAKAIGVPPNYLGKVLNVLTNAGVLASTRGPRGGFRLVDTPSELTLADVAGPFQKLPERHVCLLGDRPCDAMRPCGAHNRWQEMTGQVTAFFRTTTIAGMLNDDRDAALLQIPTQTTLQGRQS